MSTRDHQSYREDVGAYLLGALPDLEREAFEAHLADCFECRQELEELRPAAEALPRGVERFEPPRRLRAAILAEVRDEQGGPSLLERLFAVPRRLQPTVAWAAAAAVLAVGVVAGIGLGQALSGDDVRTLEASGAGGGSVPNAGATLTVTGDGEHGGILRVSGLPRPAGGAVYQAWVQRGGTVTPEPTFEVGPDGRGAVAVPDDLSGADAVMVTREPRGGSRAPSEAPLLQVGL